MSDALYNEKDRHCAGWLRNLVAAGLIAPGGVDDRDVRDVLPSDLDGHRQVHLFAGAGLWSHALRLAGWSDDRPVWTISCPCQPFSQAGGGAGVFDDRHLWPAAHWLVAQQRPRTIFGEQVASADGLAWFDIVSADLEALGYACGPVDFPSAGVGAPNVRQRLYWVADSGGDGCDQQQRGPDGESGEGIGRHQPTDGSVLVRGTPEGRTASPGRLGHAERAGLPDAEPQDVCGAGRGSEGRAATGPSGASRSWREPEWVYCHDRKYRPFEPGAFPLADGDTSRMAPTRSFPLAPRKAGDVAKLRAYGNAINPVVAAAVIRSWMDLQA